MEKQRKKEQASCCCTPDVRLRQSVNQQQQKMAKIVLFSTACLWMFLGKRPRLLSRERVRILAAAAADSLLRGGRARDPRPAREGRGA